MVTGISRFCRRIFDYYRRQGSIATVRRAVVGMRRTLFSSHMVLFYCDLGEATSASTVPLDRVQVERKTNLSALSPEDLHAVTNFWSQALALQNITERFDKGALLWLIKTDGTLAGYGWTLKGGTMEPHFFPLSQHDVHLFDFHVFPQFRGRGLNPFLVKYRLRKLAPEGACRAFIEAAEWNHAQLSSLEKTPFHRLGRARKWLLFGCTTVSWADNGATNLPNSSLHDKVSASMKNPMSRQAG